MAVQPGVLWTAAIFVLVASVPEICGQCHSSDTPKMILLDNTHTIISITSPNYPSLYPRNTVCEWQIKTSTDRVVQAQVYDMELESSFGKCVYDYVMLYDSNSVWNSRSRNSPYLARLCSKRSEGRVYYSQGQLLYVQFRSNRSGQRKGFLLTVQAVHKSRAVTSTAQTTTTTTTTTATTTTSTDKDWTLSTFFSDHVVALTVCPAVLVSVLIIVRVYYRECHRDDQSDQTSPSGPLAGLKPRPDNLPTAFPADPSLGHGPTHDGQVVMVGARLSVSNSSGVGRSYYSHRGHDLDSHAAVLAPKDRVAQGYVAMMGEPPYNNNKSIDRHPHQGLSLSFEEDNRGGQSQLESRPSCYDDVTDGRLHQTTRSRHTHSGSTTIGDRDDPHGGRDSSAAAGRGDDDDGVYTGGGGGVDVPAVRDVRMTESLLSAVPPPSYEEAIASYLPGKP